MKKLMIYSFYCVLLFAVFMTSCSQDKDLLGNFSEEQESLIGGDEVTFEEAKDIIESLGFDVSDLTDGEAYYLVEGDIRFDKKHIKEYRQPSSDSGLPQLRQARTDYLISYPNQRHITVGIDASIPTSGANNWRSEIQQAINQWNSISGCNIVMQYVTTSNPDILISGYNNSDVRVLAEGSFPLANGKPGPTIHINFNYGNGKVLPSSQKLYNMVHELGHNLGLRHTNWRGWYYGIPESTPIDISSTPTAGNNPDPNSVMNGGTAENTWNGFSYYDKTAINTLYPDFGSLTLLSFPSGNSLTSEELNKPWTICVGSGISGCIFGNLTYEWRVGGGNLVGDDFRACVNTIPTSPYTFNVSVYITNQYGETAYLGQAVGFPLQKSVNRKY